MIGAVMIGAHSARRVLALSTESRAVLALQAAGASEVLLVGEGAEAALARVRGDDRLRVPVSARTEWPAETVVVGADVVVDTKAIRAVVASGRGTCLSLDDGATVEYATSPGNTLAGSKSAALAVGGVAVLVRDDAGDRLATRALLASLRKPQDGWISNLINRHISLAVTRVLVHTGIKPNQLSIFILAIGLAGAWFAAQGNGLSLAIGGVCFQLQSILDGCDGELSRLQFRGSKAGEWLDTVGDDLTNYSFFGGAAIGLHRMGLGTLPLVLGGVGVLLGVITSGIEYRYLISIGSGDLLKYPLGFGKDPEPATPSSPVARALGMLRPLFKRDFFVFLAMLLAIAGAWPTLVMLALFVGGAVATFSAVLASEIRRARTKKD